MRRLSVGIFLIVWLVVVPRNIFAQGDGDLELNLFFGGSWHSTNGFEIGFPQAVTPIQSEFKFNQSFRGGLRFNVFTSGHWGEEFTYSFESNEARFITKSPTSSELALGMQIHQFAVNTLYYFSDDETQTVRPFLALGIGGTLYRPTDEAKSIARDPLRGNVAELNESSSFALNYGFGVKARAGSRVGFRFDVRAFLGRTPSFGLPRESDARTPRCFRREGRSTTSKPPRASSST